MNKFKEWNTKLLSLTPEEFEELCYELIEALGFINLEWIKGGKDRGRDIVAQFIKKEPGFGISIEKWVFQCKRYRSGISVDKISSAIDWAIAENADYFVIMSNSYLTPDCKEFIKKKQEQSKLKIREWTDKKFLKLLFRYPHILQSFFPNEKIPESEKIVQPQKIFEIRLEVPPEIMREVHEEFAKLMSLEEEERNEKMLKVIKERIIDSPDLDPNIRALVYQQLSVVLYNQGKLKDAVSYLDEALKITPKNRTVLMNKAFLLGKMKRYFEAILCYDKILKLNPNDKFAWNNRGHYLERSHKHRAAMRCFKKAVEIDPNFITARDNIGALLVKQHRFKEALEVFDETLRLFPNSKTTLNKKADLLKDLKDFAEAYRLINKALEVDPYFVEAINTKGVILQHNGNYQYYEKYNQLALETFEKVIELDSKYILGHTNKIVCLLNLGRFDEALEYANRTVKNFPDEEFAWMRKGEVLRAMGKYDEALKCIKKALKINKFHKKSLCLEAIIYLETQRFKKALRVTKELIRLYPRYDEGWRLRGYAFEGLGKEDKAEKCFKKVKELEIPLRSTIE